MTTRIVTLKAFITASNQRSCVEALCLQLISPLLCVVVEIAYVQAGTSPLRKAIRWGFHGSRRPFPAPVGGRDNAGAARWRGGWYIAPSQCSERCGTAHFREDEGGWSGVFVTVVSRVVLGTSGARGLGCCGAAAPGTGVQQLHRAQEQVPPSSEWAPGVGSGEQSVWAVLRDPELTGDRSHSGAHQWLIGWT